MEIDRIDIVSTNTHRIETIWKKLNRFSQFFIIFLQKETFFLIFFIFHSLIALIFLYRHLLLVNSNKCHPKEHVAFSRYTNVRASPSLDENARYAHRIRLVIVRRIFLYGNAKNEFLMTFEHLKVKSSEHVFN